MATKKPSGRGSASKKKGVSRGKQQGEAGASNAEDSAGFPIVGIGASAGGLEALTELLQELPADTHMAFVLVQHYRPGPPSMLHEILARETAMPVHAVANGLAVKPNHIYVHTGYEDLSIVDRHIVLRPSPAQEHHHMPIDHFFSALASQQGNKAIGIVLSGTASDGTLGLKAIKAMGGITIVQDLESARYDGMPASAVAAGAANLVLTAPKIARELTRIARHPYLVNARAADELEFSARDEALRRIFSVLKQRFEVDFSYYKHSTLLRRIGRRLVVTGADSIEDYARLVEDSAEEQEALYYDMLINVTAFFRDREAFDALQERIIAELLAHRGADEPLRIWIPACASGEEVYSIAITVLEYLAGHNQGGIPVQLFGTDVDERAIAQARAGVYPGSIEEDVPADYLERYFDALAEGYQIKKDIRDLCVFSVHNVLTDPPFSRLDLISCRNLLIYLGPILQKKAIPVFHFALKPEGYLLLGTAETVGDAGHLFEVIDARAKAYRKKSVETPGLGWKFNSHGVRALAPPVTAAAEKERGPVDTRRAGDQLLLDEFTPPAVIVDDKLQIQRYHGHTGPFLEPAPGAASLNLLKMVRPGLAAELRAALIEAIDKDARVHRDHLRLEAREDVRNVSIDVIPLDADEARRHFLVVFQEQPFVPPAAARGSAAEGAEQGAADAAQIQSLQQQLDASRDYLNAVIEQQETQNEELRCANEEVQSSYEELQSSNEELQSTNEELETAKEELQSSNEELRRVNAELQTRNAELSEANNDLTNLIASTDMAVVIVGPDLSMRRFTPRARELFDISDDDLGRSIVDVPARIDLPDLGKQLRWSIDRVASAEWERQDHDGHWYLVRTLPYITRERRIDGAVLVFVDIDRLKASVASADRALAYARAVVAAVDHPLLVLDRDLRVAYTNDAFETLFGLDEAHIIGTAVDQLAAGPWGQAQVREKIADLLGGENAFDLQPVEWAAGDADQRRLAIRGRRVSPGVDEGPLVLIQVDDLTAAATG